MKRKIYEQLTLSEIIILYNTMEKGKKKIQNAHSKFSNLLNTNLCSRWFHVLGMKGKQGKSTISL